VAGVRKQGPRPCWATPGGGTRPNAIVRLDVGPSIIKRSNIATTCRAQWHEKYLDDPTNTEDVKSLDARANADETAQLVNGLTLLCEDATERWLVMASQIDPLEATRNTLGTVSTRGLAQRNLALTSPEPPRRRRRACTPVALGRGEGPAPCQGTSCMRVGPNALIERDVRPHVNARTSIVTSNGAETNGTHFGSDSAMKVDGIALGAEVGAAEAMDWDLVNGAMERPSATDDSASDQAMMRKGMAADLRPQLSYLDDE
jgi:hypothetical protein